MTASSWIIYKLFGVDQKNFAWLNESPSLIWEILFHYIQRYGTWLISFFKCLNYPYIETNFIIMVEHAWSQRCWVTSRHSDNCTKQYIFFHQNLFCDKWLITFIDDLTLCKLAEKILWFFSTLPRLKSPWLCQYVDCTMLSMIKSFFNQPLMGARRQKSFHNVFITKSTRLLISTKCIKESVVIHHRNVLVIEIYVGEKQSNMQ